MEQDTNLIAFCGLYCGDCHGYQGRIPDLARDLRKELRAARYDKFAELILEIVMTKQSIRKTCNQSR